MRRRTLLGHDFCIAIKFVSLSPQEHFTDCIFASLTYPTWTALAQVMRGECGITMARLNIPRYESSLGRWRKIPNKLGNFMGQLRLFPGLKLGVKIRSAQRSDDRESKVEIAGKPKRDSCWKFVACLAACA